MFNSSELYPALTEKQVKFYKELITAIIQNPESEFSKKARKKFFLEQQKIAAIRYWFDRAPKIQLSLEELSIIKNIILSCDWPPWPIIRTIIEYQKKLTETEIIELFTFIPKPERKRVSLTIICDNRVTDINLKKKLAEELLNQEGFDSMIISKLDMELSNDETGIWKEIFYIVVNLIKKEDIEAKRLAEIWVKESTFLDLYAYHRDIESKILYELTGKIQYIPKEAQDIFMF